MRAGLQALVLFSAFAGRVLSQTPSGPGPETAPPLFDLNIRVYTWPVSGILHEDADLQALPILFFRDLNGPRSLQLTRAATTSPIRYQGNEAPVFFRASPNGNGGRPSLIPVLRPEMPPHWREALIIAYPERRNADGSWVSLVLPASRAEIPDGGNRFVNLTPLALVLELGNDLHPIGPGAELTLPAPSGGPDRFRINLFARDPIREDVRMIHTTALWREDTRGNLYIIHRQDNGRPRVLHLTSETR